MLMIKMIVLVYHAKADGILEAVVQRCSVKKGVLRNFTKFTGKHLCQSLFFNKVAGLRPATLSKRRLWAQVFSCEFCEISKNTFLHRTPLVAASGIRIN